MRFLKIAGIALLGLTLLVLTGGLILHESKPEGTPGPEADQLARSMMEAVNHQAWDTTRYVRWTFPGGHHYIWDKTEKLVLVRWDKTEVLLRTTDQTGLAFRDGHPLEDRRKEKALAKAWKLFCNDSFWLNPVVKAFDPGTTRSIVPLKDGSKGLMVAYSSGGVTPGDSYLWILDEGHLPVSWKMWVSVIPIGGIRVSWEQWTVLDCGARVAPSHKSLFGIGFSLQDIRCGQQLSDIGLEADPFRQL